MADNPSPLKTEREKYIDGILVKLEKAGKARRFLDDNDGALVTEVVTDRINGILKVIGGKSLLDNQQEYAYNVGKLHALQELLGTINAQANQNTDELEQQLREAKGDNGPESN